MNNRAPGALESSAPGARNVIGSDLPTDFPVDSSAESDDLPEASAIVEHVPRLWATTSCVCGVP
jgi:hypothetical protein